jgi:hypothetical protein
MAVAAPPPPRPKVGLYRHYKGKYYQVLFVAKHTETEEDFVVYQALYGTFEHWIRPAGMFMETVGEAPQIRPRFSFCGVAAIDWSETVSNSSFN